jgi:hypothetical protein
VSSSRRPNSDVVGDRGGLTILGGSHFPMNVLIEDPLNDMPASARALLNRKHKCTVFLENCQIVHRCGVNGGPKQRGA